MTTVVSIWFEIWGSWIRVKKKFDFSRQFKKKFNFPGKFPKNFIFFRQFKKIQFSRQKLAIYSYFLANYSIYLQESPLSNILPVHHKI